MRALVTGATGFLGRHLCRELSDREWQITRINSKTPNNEWPIREYDFIFHLAADTQAGDWCLTHSGDQWLSNQEINLHALRWWYLHSPEAKLVTIGSSCAYAPGPNLREEDYMNGEPHESLYTYAMTKRMLYEGCRALNKQFGMDYIYLVPSTLYGPDYHTDGRQAHFIFDLIKKIIRGKELGAPVVLWGDGYQRRDIIYVKDFVVMMLNLAEKRDNDIFNLSAYAESIMAFANIISKIVGYDDTLIEYDAKRYVGSKDKSLCTDKARNVIKLQFMTPLEESLKRTIDWYYESGAWK